MRYLALTQKDREEMLKTIGISKIDELYDAVPQEFLLKKPIADLPNHQGEIEVVKSGSTYALNSAAAVTFPSPIAPPIQLMCAIFE